MTLYLPKCFATLKNVCSTLAFLVSGETSGVISVLVSVDVCFSSNCDFLGVGKISDFHLKPV